VGPDRDRRGDDRHSRDGGRVTETARIGYSALHKLEHEGWITAERKPSENNRRAKFYALTRIGRKQLETEAANWKRLSAAISHVVQLERA